jgi:hypothetical protein
MVKPRVLTALLQRSISCPGFEAKLQTLRSFADYRP